MKARIPNKRHQKKGSGLERAVMLIQDTILSSDPKFRGAEFSIQTNRIVNVSGTRHEFDLWVETRPGSPYEATWIFECKDWTKPVGKNEVIVLAGKVEAVQATCGYLVARRLSKDAETQLKQSKRVRFIPCTDQFLSPLNGLELVHSAHDLDPRPVGLAHKIANGRSFAGRLESADLSL